MRFFVQSTPAPKPKTKNIFLISVATAGVFVVLAVAQLFTYEKFPAFLAEVWGNEETVKTHLSAALIVIVEVAAIPFLLSMRLSPAMRFVSMISGWLVAAVWLIGSLQGNILGVANSAFLGATIPLVQGWWSVFFSLALGVLVAWSSWGMWPSHNESRKMVK